MRRDSTPNLLAVVVLTSAILVGGADAVKAAPAAQNNEQVELQEGSFSLVPLPENPKRYSLSISDEDEHSLSGSFSADQLQILRAIMAEAEKFALTSEATATKEPVTTRFMDKQEPAFIVDVQKSGNQSLLFLTLKTEIGRMTWEAGRIIRSTRREEGFFFDLLTRLESILPKLPSQPPK